jgi:hypothetical protein
VRTGPTAFRREALGIKGRKSHKWVNPVHYKAAQAQPPTALWMKNADGREVLSEVAGPGAARPTRQVVVTIAERTQCVPFPPAWTAEHLRAALANRELSDARLEEVYLGPDEDEKVAEELKPLLKAVFGSFDAVFRYGYNPKNAPRETVRLSAGVDDTYLRGLAKLAFHYTLWAVPELSGHEPQFSPLKQFIRWGAGESNHFVQLLALQMMPDINRGQWPTVPHHFLTAYVHPDGAAAAVRLFVDAQHRLPPTLVELARGSHGVRQTFMRGHLVTYWSERGTRGYDGELTQLPVQLLG